MDAAVTSTTYLLVFSPVPTVIATAPDLKAAVIREGAEAVEGEEEDQGKQEEEEDSNGRIYRIGEEEQDVARPGRGSVETTAGEVSTASEERMNSTTSTMTNSRATTTHPASTASTRNSTRKTTEAAEAGTSAGEGTEEGDLCTGYSTI
jgi:hypothetical protein